MYLRVKRVIPVAMIAAVSWPMTADALIVHQNASGTFSAYRIDAVEREWDDARLHAATTSYLGVAGHLVTISNLTEQRRVEQLTFGETWIGLTDADALGGQEFGNTGQLPQPVSGSGAVPVAGQLGAGWKWITGEPLGFQYWAHGEPNDFFGEDAALLRADGLWNDNKAGSALGQGGPRFPSLIEYDLPSGAAPSDLFKVKLVKHYNGVTNLDVADAVLRGDIPSTSFTGDLTLMNLRDSGSDANLPGGSALPGLIQDVDNNHFVSRNVATLDVATAGLYTFAFNSGDGGRLSIDGVVLAESFGSHGPRNRFAAPIHLSEGLHEFEFIWFENSGDAQGEVGYAPGAKGALDADFRPVGDSSQGITIVGSIRSMTNLVSSIPDLNIHGVANLPGFTAGELLLNGTSPGVTYEFFADVLNFTERGTDLFFGDDDAFPGLVETNRANFAVSASAMVEIGEAGLYTFGTRSSAGARLIIDDILVINDETLSGRNAFGSILLAPGLHSLELLYYSNGENVELELFAARGQFGSFDQDAFRLVGDVSDGGLRVTQPQLRSATSVPEPSMVLTLIASVTVATRRRRPSLAI